MAGAGTRPGENPPGGAPADSAPPAAPPMRDRLALHTWTLDTTPLAPVLQVARATGWNAVELRRVDFQRAREAGEPPEAGLALVRASGLLVDAYPLIRSGDSLATVEDLSPGEIFYVQYADAPRDGGRPGQTADRLPPGEGRVPFRELFALLASKPYAGYLSYEAPNPAAWARPPEDVAREAAVATRALLPD